MTEEQPDQEFWDIADSFIEMANNLMDDADAGKANAALLYAAARFNAFIVASVEDTDVAEEKSGAIDYYSRQYRQMLSDSLDDYANNPLS